MSAVRIATPPTSRHAWRERAACLDLDTDIFFPVGEGEASQAPIERAKAICAVCPVRAECLDFALRTRQESGVWGGMTEDERRRHRRRAARARRQQAS